MAKFLHGKAHGPASNMHGFGVNEADAHLLCEEPSVARVFLHGAEQPSALAVRDSRNALTYKQLCAEIAALADLLQQHGISGKSRVLFMPDVCVESVIAYWALRSLDAIIIVGDPGSRAIERASYIERTGATHALVGTRAGNETTPSIFCIKLATSGDGLRPWVPDQGTFDGHALPADKTDDAAIILFSSGTTGTPKAIVHMAATINALHETLLATWHLSPSDRVLGALPFHTIYGLLFSAGSAIYAGAELVLMERFKPEQALAAIETNKVTTAALVPAMLLMMLSIDDGAARDLSSLRAVYTASAPISEHDIARFSAFCGAPVISNYGMTEIPGAAVERTNAPHFKRCVGQLSPGFEAVARDHTGRALPACEKGEITLRGPTLMRDYLNDPKQTRQRIRDGWIYTQDIGHVDEQGRIFLSGRTSEMIIRGGLNISPLEIEAVLSTHPNIIEAAVVGKADPILGQVVVACIVAKEKDDTPSLFDDLTQHCKQMLSSSKVPVAFHVFDQLPRNAGGKVLRKELAAQFERNDHDQKQTAGAP